MVSLSATVSSSTQTNAHPRVEEIYKQFHTCLTLALELLEFMLSTCAKEEKKKLENLLHNTRNLLRLSSHFMENHHVENENRKVEIDKDKVCSEEKKKMKMEVEKRKRLERDQEFINELNQVMKENFSDPDFNVEQLAKKLYISAATLYRKIHSLIGETPCVFIRSYRLKRAVQLLKKPLTLVTDVAYEVGFNSRTYFTKCFKDKFHLSPSGYQASEVKEN